MAEVKWIKITTDMFDNRKIKYLRKLPDGDCIVLIWVMLLTMAGRCNAGGRIYLTEDIPYTPKMLADELDFPENTVLLALQALERMNMIVSEDDGFSVVGWEEYQNIEGMDKIREQNRLRKQKQRESQRLLSEVSRDCHVTVTECHATEEEEEEDSEEDEELHSLIHGPFALTKKEQEAFGRQEYLGGTLGQGYLFISQDQFDDLMQKLSFDELHKYIDIVVECEKKGKKFKKKSHYQAILDMAKKDRAIKGGAKS